MSEPRSDDQEKFEIEFYENLVRKKPDFYEALAALGDLYTQQGFYRKGLSVDEKLVQLRPDDPIVNYNLACSYSLLHDTDKAFRSIKRAINCGYSDFKHIAQDADLKNLRDDSRFIRYMDRLNKKKSKDKDESYGYA